MNLRPTLRTALTALCAATLLAGCGGGSEPTPAPPPARPATDDSAAQALLRRAVQTLEAGTTHRLAATSSVTTAAGPQGQRLDMSVEGDAAGAQRANLAGMFGGQADRGFGLIVIDNTQYFRVGADAWRRIPPGISLPTGPTPVDAIAFLRAASGTITDRGLEPVNGEPARHLVFNLDTRKFRDELQQRGRPMADLQFSRARMDLWVQEAAGRPLKTALLLEARAGQATVTMEMTTNASDYGRAVAIDAPADFVDAGDLPAALATPTSTN